MTTKLLRFQIEFADAVNSAATSLNLAGRASVTALQIGLQSAVLGLERIHGWLQPTQGYDGQLHVEKQVEKCVTGVGRN